MLHSSHLVSSAEAAKRLGVGVTAVKRWTDAGLLPCVRTLGKHRRFRVQDLDRFARARDAAPPDDIWGGWIEVLTGSINLHGVLALLFAERASRAGWFEVASHVGDLLQEIGERWAHGALTVAEEHIASSTLARALALTAETLAVPVTGPRCLLATAEGDDHTLGLSLAEVCLREAGWRAEWAGSRTRPSDICERVRGGNVKMVAMSASAVMSDRRILRAQVRAVGRACQREGIPLVLGGAGQWPDPPPFGTLVRNWPAFTVLIRSTTI